MTGRRFPFLLAFLATAPLLAPPAAFSAEPASYRAAAIDVSLGAEHVLHGQLASPTGVPIRNGTLRLLRQGRMIGTATTDHLGFFQVRNVRGGVYQIASGDSITLIRCWEPNVAPPAARPQLLLVTDGQTLRGQQPVGNIFTDPLIIGLALAATIAIPIVINNSDRSASP